MRRDFVDWDKGLDWEDSEPGKISSSWVKDTSFFSKDYPKEEFVDYLHRQPMLFRVFRRILESKYTTVSNRQYDFKSNANVKESMLYDEGYKAALRDIHKILPRPKGD